MSKKIYFKLGVLGLILAISYGSFWVILGSSEPVTADINKQIKEAVNLYMDKRLRTEQVLAFYHQRVEKIMDTKIKLLVDRYKNPKEAERFCAASDQIGGGNFGDSKKARPCSLTDGSNYTPACVAELAAAEYEALVKAMSERRKFLSETRECLAQDFKLYNNHPLSKDDKTGKAFHKAVFDLDITANAEKQRFIDAELKKHGLALDLALKGYDELYWSYPMHVQYQETIQLLRKFNRSLIKIRHKVEDYHGKFDNAATAKCT